jgi:hypothetical protein
LGTSGGGVDCSGTAVVGSIVVGSLFIGGGVGEFALLGCHLNNITLHILVVQ